MSLSIIRPGHGASCSGKAFIRHEADGTPYIRPYLGTDAATGKPIRPYRSFRGMSDDEAAEAASEWLETVVPAKELGAAPTVEGMLTARLREMEMRRAAPKTVETYESVLRAHIAPRIGRVPYASLRPVEVVSMYTAMAGEGVGPSRILTVHAFMSGAYKAWQERGLILANPMDAVPKPRIGQAEARALDEDEYRALNAHLRSILARKRDFGSDPVDAQTAMAAFFAEHTAARVGEVCGVLRKDVRPQWGDVLIARTASETKRGVILKETKGKKSAAIALDDDLKEQISDWMRFQKEEFPEATPKTTLLSLDGLIVRPSAVSKRFKELCREIGLPKDVHFHTLRHTYITYQIMDGANLVEAQNLARHRSFSTTVNLYGHLMPSRSGQAVRFGDVSRRIEGGENFGWQN